MADERHEPAGKRQDTGVCACGVPLPRAAPLFRNALVTQCPLCRFEADRAQLAAAAAAASPAASEPAPQLQHKKLLKMKKEKEMAGHSARHPPDTPASSSASCIPETDGSPVIVPFEHLKDYIISISDNGTSSNVGVFVDISMQGLDLVPSGILEEMDAQTGRARLLLRSTIRRLLRELEARLVGGQTAINITHVLCGDLAGTGKSTALFLAAQFARQLGCFVLHVNLGALLVTPGIDHAREFLRLLYQQLGLELPTNEPADGWMVLLSQVLDGCLPMPDVVSIVPVLLALDQWNSVFSHPDNGLAKVLRRPFYVYSHHRCSNLLVLAATSSLFDPVDETYAGSVWYLSRRIHVDPYSPLEWRTMTQMAVQMNQLPADLDLDALGNRAGHLPLLLHWAKQAHGRHDPDGVVGGMERRACDYYHDRVANMLTSADTHIQLASLAAGAVANDLVMSYGAAYAIVHNAGLIVEEHESHSLPKACKVACPAVHLAFVQHLASHDELQRIAGILAGKIKYYHRELLRLVVAMTFTRPGMLALAPANRVGGGTWPLPLTLATTHRYMQEFVGDVGGAAMQPGTVYVCAQGHPAADLVIFTATCQLIFVQVLSSLPGVHSYVNELFLPTPQRCILMQYAMKLPEGSRRQHPLRIRIIRWLEGLQVTGGTRPRELPLGVHYVVLSCAPITAERQSHGQPDGCSMVQLLCTPEQLLPFFHNPAVGDLSAILDTLIQCFHDE